jgi:site-specific recombinase XerD
MEIRNEFIQMNFVPNRPMWLSLSAAAGLIDVSEQDILRRAVPWQAAPVAHRIRFRLLTLDPDQQGTPRFFAPDVERLLSKPEGSPDVQVNGGNADSTVEPKDPRHKLVERGIYRSTKSGLLSERPVVDGKRTWRSLGTTRITAARAELRRRKAARQSGEEEPEPEYLKSVGEVIRYYQGADYPDKQLNSRSDRTRKEEARHCDLLLKFWDAVRVKRTSIVSCDQYRDWRLKRLKQGTGLRTIDRELTTLNNAFRLAYRKGLIARNPLVDRPKYQSSKNVEHCRQFMPGDANELHGIAKLLFSYRSSEVLGFQFLYTGYTGQRTCEILKLKINAGPDEPGSLLENGKCLRVWRAKGQDLVNPFCTVHEGLEGLIAAHKQWIADRYPDATWFFPGRGGDELVDKAALAHALRRLRERGIIKRKITPHGARAWFVTVRRSHGAPDSQIALEIGHTSGGSTLSSVYGGVPPEWTRGGGPKMSWMPSGPPAWSDLLLDLQRARAEVGGAFEPTSSHEETRSSTKEGASFAETQAVGSKISDNRPNA